MSSVQSYPDRGTRERYYQQPNPFVVRLGLSMLGAIFGFLAFLEAPSATSLPYKKSNATEPIYTAGPGNGNITAEVRAFVPYLAFGTSGTSAHILFWISIFAFSAPFTWLAVLLKARERHDEDRSSNDEDVRRPPYEYYEELDLCCGGLTACISALAILFALSFATLQNYFSSVFKSSQVPAEVTCSNAACDQQVPLYGAVTGTFYTIERWACQALPLFSDDHGQKEMANACFGSIRTRRYLLGALVLNLIFLASVLKPGWIARVWRLPFRSSKEDGIPLNSEYEHLETREDRSNDTATTE